MTNTDKEITQKLTEAVDALPETERKYVLGLADGMAIAKHCKKRKNVKLKTEENRIGDESEGKETNDNQPACRTQREAITER